MKENQEKQDNQDVINVVREEYEKKLAEQQNALREEYEAKLKQEHEKNLEYIRTIIQGRQEPMGDSEDEYNEEDDIERIANKIVKEFK